MFMSRSARNVGHIPGTGIQSVLVTLAMFRTLAAGRTNQMGVYSPLFSASISTPLPTRRLPSGVELDAVLMLGPCGLWCTGCWRS